MKSGFSFSWLILIDIFSLISVCVSNQQKTLVMYVMLMDQYQVIPFGQCLKSYAWTLQNMCLYNLARDPSIRKVLIKLIEISLNLSFSKLIITHHYYWFDQPCTPLIFSPDAILLSRGLTASIRSQKTMRHHNLGQWIMLLNLITLFGIILTNMKTAYREIANCGRLRQISEMVD